MSHTNDQPYDHDERLDALAEAVRDDIPSSEETHAAAERVWARIAAADAAGASEAPIQGCADVQALIPAYVAGEVAGPKALLLEDHTRSCIPCRKALKAAREGRTITAPAAPAHGPGDAWGDISRARRARAEGRGKSDRRSPWLAVAAVVVAAIGLAVVTSLGLLPGASTAVAEVRSIDGQLYRVTDDGNVPVTAGTEIARGELVRTGQGSNAVIQLADGSQVELAERSELEVRTGRRDTVIDLAQGNVIVQAAQRSRGHLFVDTEDCRVAVTGTIFAVNHGTKGSRVSVVEGSVRVEQSRREDMLSPGDQVTTRASLAAVPISQEISWSRDSERYLALLAELQAIDREIRSAVDTPGPRTSTRLLAAAPVGTVIWAAAPNLAEEVVEARRIFRERLAVSPVLSETLEDSGYGDAQEQIDELIQHLADFGSFLGDEVAFAALADETGDPEMAFGLAEVLQPQAFRSYLEVELPRLTEGELSVVVVESAAELAGVSASDDETIYVLLASGLAAISPHPEALVAVDAALAGDGLAGSRFAQVLEGAYAEGVEWLMAVDVASIANLAELGDDDAGEGIAFLGLDNAAYILGRWSESGGSPSGRAEVVFDGQRHGVASWLSGPAPMGSLELVSSDAAAVSAFLTREPVELVDELFAVLFESDPEALDELARLEREQGIDIREDLAAPLGGEMAFALDGPLVPVPSFKLIVEVNDRDRLQQSLEYLVTRFDEEVRARQDGTDATGLVLEQVTVTAGQPVYRIAAVGASGEDGPMEVFYTYIGSYLVAAPSEALLSQARQIQSSGTSIVTSTEFQDLLPRDGYTNFSAVAFQSFGDKVGPLMNALRGKLGESGMTDENQQELEERLGAPALFVAYGGEDRISIAGTYGGEGLSLVSLLGSGGLTGLTGPGGLLSVGPSETDDDGVSERSAQSVVAGGR